MKNPNSENPRPIVKGHAPVSGDGNPKPEAVPNNPSESDSTAGDGLCAPLCSLVRSLLFERSHSEEYPTRFSSSTEKTDGTHVWELIVKIPVSKEEHEILMDNDLWNRDIIYPRQNSPQKME